MLVKKNKACEAIEKILGFGFEELEFVGKYNNIIDSDFLTTIYKRNKELYIAQLCYNKIFAIYQITDICRGLNTKMAKNFSIKDKEYSYAYKEPNCFMTTMINGIMYYIKYKELLYITKCDRKYNYIHFKNGKTLVKGDLLIEDAEMVMIKMLGDFINEEVVKQWGGWLNDDKENLYNR